MLEATINDDQELIQHAQKGDVEAIGKLYDRHHERIFRYIWSRTSNKQVAEDLTGEVFIRMVSSLPDYEVTGKPFTAWLYRIAHNLVIDYYRKSNQHTSLPLHYAEKLSMNERSPSTVVEQKLSWDKVQAALEKIDPDQRDVVVLRFLVGLSLKEVAHSLDRTVASVKSLQHRGLKALRVALK